MMEILPLELSLKYGMYDDIMESGVFMLTVPGALPPRVTPTGYLDDLISFFESIDTTDGKSKVENLKKMKETLIKEAK